MVLMNTAIFSFSNTDKLCPIILSYALLKHLTCEHLFTVANYLWYKWISLTMTNVINTLTVAE